MILCRPDEHLTVTVALMEGLDHATQKIMGEVVRQTLGALDIEARS